MNSQALQSEHLRQKFPMRMRHADCGNHRPGEMNYPHTRGAVEKKGSKPYRRDLEGGLDYAWRFWPVFPLHWPMGRGQ